MLEFTLPVLAPSLMLFGFMVLVLLFMMVYWAFKFLASLVTGG